MSRMPGVCGQCYCASTAQRHPPRLDRIIDHHYIKTDKASGLVDLIKRVVTVSVRTVEPAAGLPRGCRVSSRRSRGAASALAAADRHQPLYQPLRRLGLTVPEPEQPRP